MSKQKALFLTAKHGPFAVGTTSILKPGPGELLVKVHAAALNPVDWKIQVWGIYATKFPVILGTDKAGSLEGWGEGVTEWEKGDKVFCQSLTHLDINEHAGFQQYTLSYADVTAKGQAATIPLGLATAVVGLYNQHNKIGSIGLHPFWEPSGLGKCAESPIVILGGASSVGQFGMRSSVTPCPNVAVRS